MALIRLELLRGVFGFPTEGNFHVGQYAEFKDNGGWKLVKVVPEA